MVVNPLKVFLFLAGGTVAAGATAYVSGALDPYLYDQTAAAVADLPRRRHPNRPPRRASACPARRRRLPPMRRPSRRPPMPR